MVMRIKVQYICMAFLYVGGFPLYAQKVTDDTISGKTHYRVSRNLVGIRI